MFENVLLGDVICAIEISFQDLRDERDVQLHFVLQSTLVRGEGAYASTLEKLAIASGVYLLMSTSVLQILTA